MWFFLSTNERKKVNSSSSNNNNWYLAEYSPLNGYIRSSHRILTRTQKRFVSYHFCVRSSNGNVKLDGKKVSKRSGGALREKVAELLELLSNGKHGKNVVTAFVYVLRFVSLFIFFFWCEGIFSAFFFCVWWKMCMRGQSFFYEWEKIQCMYTK